MSEEISRTTVKLEINSSDSTSYPEKAKQTKGKRRKRNRRAGTRRSKRRKQELKDPCAPMLPEGFLENLPEVVAGEIKDPCAPMLPESFLEDLTNAPSHQSLISDEEFDPWTSIFADADDTSEEFSSGPDKESTPPRASVEKESLTWAERFLSSV